MDELARWGNRYAQILEHQDVARQISRWALSSGMSQRMRSLRLATTPTSRRQLRVKGDLSARSCLFTTHRDFIIVVKSNYSAPHPERISLNSSTSNGGSRRCSMA